MFVGKGPKNRISIISTVFVALLSSTFWGCSRSKDPEVREIIVTRMPTIMGEAVSNLSTSTNLFTVQGTCDPNSNGLQYSLNQGGEWIDIPGGCPANGQYGFDIFVTFLEEVWVRAGTRFAFTDFARANVRLVIPPTGPLLNLVTSSASPRGSATEPRLVMTMPSTFSGAPPHPADNFKVHLHTTGIVYGD